MMVSTPAGHCQSLCGCEMVVCAHSHNAIKQQQQPAQEKTYKARTTSGKKGHSALPETFNIDGWLALSGKLRLEDRRVLSGLDGVCGLTFMAVHPDLHKRGTGSMMLERLCDETDRCQGRCAYVVAAPEGVLLYSRSRRLMATSRACPDRPRNNLKNFESGRDSITT